MILEDKIAAWREAGEKQRKTLIQHLRRDAEISKQLPPRHFHKAWIEAYRAAAELLEVLQDKPVGKCKHPKKKRQTISITWALDGSVGKKELWCECGAWGSQEIRLKGTTRICWRYPRS